MTWARIVATTITDHIREEEKAILRNRKLTGLLESNGRITYNHSGDGFDWRVRYARTPVQGYTDTNTQNITRHNQWKKANLPYRAYSSGEGISKMEMLENAGEAAIVKFSTEFAELLIDDMREFFATELYIDGYAAGNEEKIHGLESMMGGSYTSGKTFTSDDSYAGLSTKLGNYGGTLTGTWPLGGVASAEYDFWTPPIFHYGAASPNWDASSASWKNNCEQVLRYAIQAGRRNSSKQNMLDLVLLDMGMYNDFTDVLDPKESINVTPNQGNTLVALGFTDVTRFDGCDITAEYGLPSSSATDTRIGYGLTLAAMELRSMQPQLFVMDKDYEITQKMHRMTLDFFGNMRFKSPRNFFKLVSSG